MINPEKIEIGDVLICNIPDDELEYVKQTRPYLTDEMFKYISGREYEVINKEIYMAVPVEFFKKDTNEAQFDPTIVLTLRDENMGDKKLINTNLSWYTKKDEI